MTTPPTITARSDSLRPRPDDAPALRSELRAGIVVVALFALALSGCSAHDYAFTCGLVAGVLIGCVLSGAAVWLADATWRGDR